MLLAGDTTPIQWAPAVVTSTSCPIWAEDGRSPWVGRTGSSPLRRGRGARRGGLHLGRDGQA
jgi:hypothetical protein